MTLPEWEEQEILNQGTWWEGKEKPGPVVPDECPSCGVQLVDDHWTRLDHAEGRIGYWREAGKWVCVHKTKVGT